MMENNDIFIESHKISVVIAKIIRNVHITDKERSILNSWLETDPQNASTYNDLISKKKDLNLLDFFSECEEFDNRFMKEFRKRNRTLRRFKSASILSGIAVAVTIIISILIPQNIDSSDLIAQSSDTVIYLVNNTGEKIKIDDKIVLDIGEIVTQSNPKEILANQTNTIIVPLRKNIKIILSDGTVVWLNSSSKLSFPSEFGKDNREVTLVGEGYFEVNKDSKRPFYVRTAHLTTKVLGTKFYLTAFNDDMESSVSLMEGSVKVETESSDVILAAGQGVICDSKNGIKHLFKVNTEKLESIFSDKFLFKNERLEDIAKVLQRWYGVEIIFKDDSMKDLLFYINTNKYEDINDFMSLLKETNNLNYSVENNKLIINN